MRKDIKIKRRHTNATNKVNEFNENVDSLEGVPNNSICVGYPSTNQVLKTN